jgi:hypothetical protein
MDFDLEELYRIFPRHIGKTKGLLRAKRAIKTQKDYDNLKLAIENYSNHVSGFEKQFIKHFSSFMSDWEDWIDFEEEQSHAVDIAKIRSIK